MSEFIRQSSITSPKKPSNTISRSHLLKLLDNNPNKKLTLICAPAGSGKTTLIQDYLSQAGKEFAWLNGTSEINGFYQFIAHIVHSFKKIDKDFGENILQLADSYRESIPFKKDSSNIIRSVTGTFINEFCACFDRDIVFVFDDLHELEESPDEWLCETFSFLLENLPNRLRLIISTRSAPSFDLTGLHYKREIFEIGEKQLKFNSREISEVLENLYSVPHTTEDVKFLLDKLDGWITGIHMILQAYGKNFNKASLQQGTLQGNLFDYFAYTIFENLDKRTREFLLSTSLLENFTCGLCDYLLDINDSKNIIEQLKSKNIFIQYSEISSGSAYYNYQNLFRNFLTSKFYDSASIDEINSLMRKVSEFYSINGEIVPAVTYALKGKDYSAALPLILETAPTLIDEGKLDILWNWLFHIPDGMVEENAYLSYCLGRLYKYYHGDLNKSLEIITKLISRLNIQKEPKLLVDCYMSKTDSLLKLGKYEEAITDLTSLLKADVGEQAKASLLYTLASAYFRCDRDSEAIELLNDSLRIAEKFGLNRLKVNILRLLGTIHLNKGEFITARFFYEQITDKPSNIQQSFITIINLVILNSESGEYDRAISYLKKASELLKKFSSVFLEIHFLTASSYFRIEGGDYEECIKISEQLKSLANRNDLKYDTYLSYMTLCEAYYYLNKPEAAEQYCDLAYDNVNPKNKEQQVTQSFLKAVILKKFKSSPNTEQIILEVYKYNDSHKLFLHKMQTAYHLADYYLKVGKQNSALKYLDEFLKTCEEKQYVPFIEREFLDNRIIFDFAIRNNRHKKFIRYISERVFNKPDLPWLSDECKRRLKKEINNLYDISMESLGRFQFKLRGKPIPEKTWSRKAAKQMLAYLLLNRNRTATKDELTDVFFRDLSPESAENSLHQAIANIKKAVQSVIYERGKLKLDDDGFYKTDAEEFESLFKAGKFRYQQAADLYKGEFLPGYKGTWCDELREYYSGIFLEISNELKKFPK